MPPTRTLPAELLFDLVLVASDTAATEEIASQFVSRLGEAARLRGVALWFPRAEEGGPLRLLAHWAPIGSGSAPRDLSQMPNRPAAGTPWVSDQGSEAIFGLAGNGALWLWADSYVQWLAVDDRLRRVLERLGDGLVRARSHARALRELDDTSVAHRQTAEAADRLSALVDSLEGAVLVETRSRRIAMANAAFCRLFGVPASPQDLVGADCALAAQGTKALFRDPVGFLAGVDKCLADGSRVVGEILEMADGRVLERDFIPVAIDGRPGGQLWHYREVTARVKAEREIARLKQLYEQVLDAMPVQLAVFDPEGRYVHVTPSAIADAETRRWIVGKTDVEYCQRRGLPPAIGLVRRQRLAAVAASGRPERLEESFTDRQGERRHFIRFVHPVLDAEGRVVQVLGYGLDISDLKRAEARLASSQALVAAVLNAALDGILTLDAEGRIIDLNPAAEVVLGIAHQELLGRSMTEFLVREKRGELRPFDLARLLHRRRASFLSRRIEVTGLRLGKEGESFPAEISLHELHLAEEPGRFTIYLRDISERKRAERLLTEAKQAAEESARARERFLANMSHEIRTPLNGVIGMTHLLEATELSAQQRRYLGAIRFSADTLYALINDVLDFSKIEAGGLVFESISFRLDALLRELVEATRFSAERKGLELRLDVAPELARLVIGDPIRLKQILMNLVGNAVKFTERGTVVLGATPLREADGALHVQFWVADTGIGIAPDKRASIFDAFTQERSDTTRRFGGTGLGLAIVKQLVELQGGRIAVESSVGSGSVFTVYLRFASTREEACDSIEQRDLDPTRLGGARILLVEDNAMNQLVATEVLRQEGAVVTVAANGEEALAELARQPFDLVLMDLQMPVMDGFEAARRIRQELRIASSALPIVALSASTLAEEKEQAFASGMDDFVMKPFDPGNLRIRIASHIARLGRRSAGAAPELAVQPDLGAAAAESEAAPIASATPLVDFERLTKNALGRPALVREILGLYLAETPSLLAELVAAASELEVERIRSAAHKLKSTSGVIGATGLQALAEDLERTASDLSPGELATRTASTARLGQSVLQALCDARPRFAAG